MREPTSSLPEERRRVTLRPLTYIPVLVVSAIIIWIMATVWNTHRIATNEELQRAYRQGFNAALDTKRVKPELEGACLTLWWGQNVRTTD